MTSKNKIFKGLFWNYLERFAKEGSALIISIVLANILEPEHFGTIAILNVFIAFSNVLILSGFNTALIQKKEIDKIDISSVFYCSFSIAILLYLVLFFVAPLIANFYNMPILKNILRVIALTLPFGAYNSIQTALVMREMRFKIIFISSIISVIFSGVLGIISACLGFGIWSLAIQTVSTTVLSCVTMQILTKWKPTLDFSLTRLKKLLSFSWKLTVSSIIDSLYIDVYNLIIGKKYSSATLAYYNRGQQFPLLLARNVTSSISNVMLPVYSQLQNDKEAIKDSVRKSVSICSFVMFPLIFGLLACSKPIILILYTEKWIETIPYMQLFCIAFLFYPINMANIQVLNGMGRSDLFLKMNIYKKLLGIIGLVITFPFGVKAIAASYTITSVLSVVINVFPNKKLLNYGIYEQFKDIFPSLLLGMVMCVVCLVFVNFINNNFLLLIAQIFMGVLIYIGGAHAFKLKSFLILLETAKNLKNKKTKN